MSQSRRSLADHVATRLRVEMARLNVAPYELARRLNEQPLWVSRRMRGIVPIALIDLERIARALDVEPVAFVATVERVP